jgi:hypothetical protein
MRMKGARKNAQGMITEPGNMVIYVAGYPAIMGLQPLYFRRFRARPPRPDTGRVGKQKTREHAGYRQRIKHQKRKTGGATRVLLQADLERSSVFMDSTVSESSKAEEIILPGNSVFDSRRT